MRRGSLTGVVGDCHVAKTAPRNDTQTEARNDTRPKSHLIKGGAAQRRGDRVGAGKDPSVCFAATSPKRGGQQPKAPLIKRAPRSGGGIQR